MSHAMRSRFALVFTLVWVSTTLMGLFAPAYSFAEETTIEDTSTENEANEELLDPELTPAPEETTPAPEETIVDPEPTITPEVTPTPEPTEDESLDQNSLSGARLTEEVEITEIVQGPTAVSYTLEGCRNPTGYNPAGGDVICETTYTTGNLGKEWNELDLVPYRLTTSVGNNGPAEQTYSVIIVNDYMDGGKPGYDKMSVPTFNADLSTGTEEECAFTASPEDKTQSYSGGIDLSIARTITFANQPKGETCVLDYWARLAIGSRQFPGSSLHANLVGVGETVGQKEVSIPVKEIEPQKLDVIVDATQSRNYPWTISKTAPASVSLGNTCLEANRESSDVSIEVSWTKGAAQDGPRNVTATITATNPAHRPIEVKVTSLIKVDGTTVDTKTFPTSGYEPVSAGGSKQFVHTYAVTQAGTITVTATGEYYDPLSQEVVGQLAPPPQTAQLGTINPTVQDDTATVSDVESISGSNLEYKIVATGAPAGTYLVDHDNDPNTAGQTYTLGTWTNKPVTWSALKSASGSATFTKRVRVTQATVLTNGSLSDTATVKGTDTGTTRSASDSTSITAQTLAALTINKTIPDVLDGQETATFNFKVQTAAGVDVPNATGSITFTSGQTSKSTTLTTLLAPGSYKVVEESVTNWGTDSEKAFTIDAGECSDSVSFSNTISPATANAKKVTVPSGDESGWEMTLTGPGTSSGTGPNATTGITATTTGTGAITFQKNNAPFELQEGSYTVTESFTGHDGYSQANATSTGCTFTVDYPADAGRTFSCEFTNRASPASAKAVKTTVPAGNEEDWEFTLSDDDNTTTDEVRKTNSSGVATFTTELRHGVTYTITETEDDDWTAGTPGDECSFTVDLPDDSNRVFSCEITNTAKPAHAKVKKVTIPAGSEAGWTFDLREGGADGDILDTVTTTEEDEDGYFEFDADLEHGQTYTITERPGDERFRQISDDCSFTVELPAYSGEYYSCTITNAADGAYASVQKSTRPSTPGSLAGWTFSLRDTDADETIEQGTTDESGQIVFETELEDGRSYEIVETARAGWDQTSTSDECSFTVDLPADTDRIFDCEIENTQRGSIVVEKQTNPDGSLLAFGFTGDAAGSIVDGANITVSDLVPGTYTSTEAAQTGWQLTGIVCNDSNSTGSTSTRTATFVLDPGETVKCTFTNTQDQPPPPPPLADVAITKIDSADPVTAGDNFSYTLQVTNNGPATAQNVAVSDPLPAGTGFVDVTTTLGTCEGGQTVICSLGTMGAGTSATIVITVSTSDDTPSDLLNTATTTTTTPESRTDNNQDTEPTTIVRPPVVSRIVVEKQTLPDGSDEIFDFTGDVTATLGDGETAIVDVEPGSYSVTEIAVEGWDLTAIECDDDDSTGDLASATASFEVAEGETVKCTFTNLEEEVLGEIIDKEPKPSGPEVLPKVIEPEVQPSVLPFTGGDPVALIALAALMMLTGAAVLFTNRRRAVIEE